ncbi:MAG: FAD-dependent oxidoreductase [Candidatus Eremiobacteraeota bacterium]|nr:FAD-dependent oxidoreductase [Candidatus Eremiobacteraeota bacterium]
MLTRLSNFSPSLRAGHHKRRPAPSQDSPKVVVLGGGYAGVEFVESLKAPVHLTLVDRKPDQTYKTKLWKVTVGGKDSSEAQQSLAKVVGKAGGQLQLGQVTDIDLATRQVVLDHGQRIPYDYLVVALGSRPTLLGHPEWAEHVLTLDQPEDTQRIRDTVRSQAMAALAEADPARRRQQLEFVVVGGGATGIELAGIVADLVEQVDPSLSKDLNLTLVHSRERLCQGMPDEVSRRATAALLQKGVTLRLNERLADVAKGQVKLASGEVLPASAIMLAVGTESPEVLQCLGPTTRGGRVEVTDHLTLPDHPEVFVVGDAALVRSGGQAVPADKHSAKEAGETAADNLARSLDNQPMRAFSFHGKDHYKHIGPVNLR